MSYWGGADRPRYPITSEMQVADEEDIQPPEPIEGLPELPPEGEQVLWQGRPTALALASDALLMRWVVGCFALLALWRGTVGWERAGPWEALESGAIPLGMGLVLAGVLLGSAWVMARSAVYTVTNRRIAMRVGAALTVTVNLPYRWIRAADLALSSDCSGTVAFDLLGQPRLSYFALWPHVRPWRMRDTQPAFRSLPNAEDVANLVALHAQAAVERCDPSQPSGNLVPAE